MQLTIKTQLIILVSTLIIGVLLGSQLKKSPVEIATKTETKQKEETHEHTVTTITKEKDGTEVTKIDDVRGSIEVSDTQHSTVVKSRSVNVSALIGVSIHDPLVPVYGMQITKPLFLNLTVGGYALTNGTAGVSVGWDF